MAEKRTIFCLFLFCFLSGTGRTQSARNDPSPWTCRDALGRTVGTSERYGALRPGKAVGIFYFIWHGAHGYDRHAAPASDQSVRPPSAADTASPYDIQKILDADPRCPQYGPDQAFHHWGEPYLGYYTADDRWVIRRHAQMLSDAGIDVIILDATNGLAYLPQVKTLCDEYRRMRAEGSRTPQIAFILNSAAASVLKKLTDEFYGPELYRELWFEWKGKPLLLCPPEAVTPQAAEFFTIRHSWFCSHWEWFGDGRDKWPWADFYPQKAGWHESPDKPECVAVAAATLALANRGRSFHRDTQPDAAHCRSGEGLCFAEQFSRAMELDPEFIFFTGWNEWVAMRYTDGGATEMLGKPISKGDTYFVDNYNHEFSRDIEPLRGDFGDNYYYQLCDFIRRFKGVEPQPVHRLRHAMRPGRIASWRQVGASYADDRGDTFHRDHYGYGSAGRYVNTTGRNDFVESKVATDGKNIYFYIRTQEPVTPRTDSLWMRLFVGLPESGSADWEGFRFRINARPGADGLTSLERSKGGWRWETVARVPYCKAGCEMSVAVPLRELGIRNADDFAVDFKWIDNAVAGGDIRECLTDGDAAPGGRFRYRYRFRR